jgi:hypothetical protein
MRATITFSICKRIVVLLLFLYTMINHSRNIKVNEVKISSMFYWIRIQLWARISLDALRTAFFYCCLYSVKSSTIICLSKSLNWYVAILFHAILSRQINLIIAEWVSYWKNHRNACLKTGVRNKLVLYVFQKIASLIISIFDVTGRVLLCSYEQHVWRLFIESKIFGKMLN